MDERLSGIVMLVDSVLLSYCLIDKILLLFLIEFDNHKKEITE